MIFCYYCLYFLFHLIYFGPHSSSRVFYLYSTPFNFSPCMNKMKKNSGTPWGKDGKGNAKREDTQTNTHTRNPCLLFSTSTGKAIWPHRWVHSPLHWVPLTAERFSESGSKREEENCWMFVNSNRLSLKTFKGPIWLGTYKKEIHFPVAYYSLAHGAEPF